MIFSILYVIDSALSRVLIDYSLNGMPVALVLLGVSIIAVLYFSFVARKNLITTYKVIFTNKKNTWLFLKLNINVLVMWALTYYSIHYVGASMSAFLFFMTLAVATSLHKYNRLDIKNSIFSILFLICIILAITNQQVSIWYSLLPIFAGLSGFLYNIISSATTKAMKFSASETLAVRFWALLIVLPFFLPADLSSYFTAHNIIVICIIGGLSFMLQAWLCQKGLDASGAHIHGFLIMYAPAATYILQAIFLHEHNYILLLLSMVVPGLIVIKNKAYK